MKRTIFVLIENQKAENDLSGGITHEDVILHGAFANLEDCKKALTRVAETAISKALEDDDKEVINYYKDNFGAHMHYVERFPYLTDESENDFVTIVWRIKTVSLEEP